MQNNKTISSSNKYSYQQQHVKWIILHPVSKSMTCRRALALWKYSKNANECTKMRKSHLETLISVLYNIWQRMYTLRLHESIISAMTSFLSKMYYAHIHRISMRIQQVWCPTMLSIHTAHAARLAWRCIVTFHYASSTASGSRGVQGGCFLSGSAGQSWWFYFDSTVKRVLKPEFNFEKLIWFASWKCHNAILQIIGTKKCLKKVSIKSFDTV